MTKFKYDSVYLSQEDVLYLCEFAAVVHAFMDILV